MVLSSKSVSPKKSCAITFTDVVSVASAGSTVGGSVPRLNLKVIGSPANA